MEETKSILSNIIKSIETGTNGASNANVEKGEFRNNAATGKVTEIEGEKHEDGGVSMNLNQGDRILSDSIAPKGKKKKEIEDKFDIKVGKKDSYSDILRKIENKIGINKIEVEQEDILARIEKNQKTKDENTKVLNDGVLGKKLGALQEIKESLEPLKEESFNVLYEHQESDKKSENTSGKFAEGGRNESKLADDKDFLSRFNDIVNANKFGITEHPQQHAKDAKYPNLYNLSIDQYNERVGEYFNMFPELAGKYFKGQKSKDGKITYAPINNKDTLLFQNEYNEYIDKAVKKFDLSGDEEYRLKQKLKFRPKTNGNDSSQLLDGLMGLDASSRSGVKAPILPKEKIDALNKAGIYHLSTAAKDVNKLFELGLGTDDVSRIKEEIAKYGDYYMLPTIESPQNNNAASNIQEAAKTIAPQNTDKSATEEKKQMQLANRTAILPGIQSMPPSELKLPKLVSPTLRDETYLKVSPEKAIVENNRTLNYISDQLQNSETGAIGGNIANIAAKVFDSNLSAVDQANAKNAELRVNYDNNTSRRIDAYDQNRERALQQYVELSQRAEDNTTNDWREFLNNEQKKNIDAFRDYQTRSMAEAMTPTVNWNPNTGPYEYLPVNLSGLSLTNQNVQTKAKTEDELKMEAVAAEYKKAIDAVNKSMFNTPKTK